MGNYIAGSNTTSVERGGIYLNHNANGSGNQALTATPVEVSGNTIINAQQPVHISAIGCGNGPASIVNFSNNLIANGVDGVAEYEGTTVTAKGAVRYDCALDLASTFTGEAYYSATVYNEENGVAAGALPFDASSIFGLDGEAELVPSTNGLIDGAGAAAGIGADTTLLRVIAEDEVGAGSTTTF